MHLLQPGTLFGGRYEIVRTLSTGGMGVVYEVLHRDTKRKRAMKVMLPHVLANDDMRERFKREGLVTAGIESEHLVEVFDVGIDESGAPFLVMELLRGEDLGARITRGERTRPADALEILEQVCRALERTHAAAIVHRDLKPENLFVTHRDDGTLRMKILDFGIAKLIDRSSKDTASVGTPLYMAPEQMTGRSAKIGPASDVYALGQIAFTLLVGVPYFQPEDAESTNLMGLLYRVTQGTTEPAVDRARALGVELPYGLNAWFARATALEPDKRYPGVTEFLAELRTALKGAPEELPSSSAKRRAVAFQPTQPLSEAAPLTRAMAQSAQSFEDSAPQEVAGKTRASVGQLTGPVPSSHTIGLAESAKPGKSKLPIVLGAAVAAGIAGVIALSVGGNGATQGPAQAVDASNDVTGTSQPANGGPPIEVLPSGQPTSTPTATAEVSTSVSAEPSATPTTTPTGIAVRPTALIPSKLPTAKVTVTTPVPVPTMWSGGR